MRRLLTACLLAIALCGLASPVARADEHLLSMMMDDDHLLYRGDKVRDFTLQRMKQIGVDYVRVSVLWSVVAENARFDKRGKRIKRFKAENPRTYPRGNWDRYDRLVRAGKALGIGIYFNVTGPGPRWAMGKAPKKYRKYQRSWEPNPREFFKFVKAVGKRYDGKYRDENDGRKVLPRVSFWSIYNEPNHQGWLTPQYKGGIPWSPVLYRDLWYQGRKALDATGHRNDTVLIGETAPFGSTASNVPSPIYPKRWIREFFCLNAAGKPYTGSAAKKRRCDTLKRIRPNSWTVWAHHPYTKFDAPTKLNKHADAITMANIDDLPDLLDAAGAATGLTPATGNKVAVTEFGYETNPPDRFSGIKPELQAEWNNIGDMLAVKNPRITAITQFLLRDVPGVKKYKKTSKKHWFTYQSGLYYANGRAKPSAAAFTMPLVLTGRTAEALTFWGWARFLPVFDPEITPQYAMLQFRPAGARSYETIGDPIPLGMFAHFEAAVQPQGPGTWRALWVEQFSGTPIASREISVSG
jgi:hypothetical protein